MEAQECCILGICCEPGLAQDELATKLHAEVQGLSVPHANAVAAFIHAHYDLAPLGLFAPLRDAIAEEARQYPYRES